MSESSDALRDAKSELEVARAKVRAMRPWYQKKRVLVPVVLALVVLISVSVGSDGRNNGPVPIVNPSNQIPNQEEQSTETANQKNARLKAQQYLSFSAFSRKGLIDQLQFEGFNTLDAEYGTDAQNADWRNQAALKAAQYLQVSAFSKQGLIDQLLFEGFSLEDAEFGVSSTGLN